MPRRSGRRWGSLRAARLDPGGGAATIAVTIQECHAAARLGVFARSHALTAREREIATLLAAGVAGSALAGRLGITGNTLQDHFKAIYAKTGVHSREELLARALGGA
ncbi:helix-turn-helix domain-containing protein [Specibacter cremeus]|uniref:helix-turn-helix domain-containing protein n=1 Tax=Specibacter cremeus TaxID=1629051 RepID=UPI0013DE50FA|nr:helix-turn-helix transcriptional regulator [Specibacter cremeus]